MCSLTQGHLLLQDADNQASGHINQRDNHACDGVSFDELHCAVQRSIEPGLHGQLASFGPRLGKTEQPRSDVRVNRHLLPRQSIESKAGGHLGYALRPLGHNEKLHDRDDGENNGTDRHISPHDEIPERGHYFRCRSAA